MYISYDMGMLCTKLLDRRHGKAEYRQNVRTVLKAEKQLPGNLSTLPQGSSYSLTTLLTDNNVYLILLMFVLITLLAEKLD